MGLFGNSGQSFWQGGDKFRARDGIAGLLAVVGDAFAQQGGNQGFGVQGLLGGRLSAQKLRQDALAAEAERAAAIQDYERKKQIDQRYQQPETPAIGKNLDYFMGNIMNDPQRLQAFTQYQDLVNPRYAQGADGLQYQQRRALPSAPVGKLTPIPDGGPASAPGSFRPY